MNTRMKKSNAKRLLSWAVRHLPDYLLTPELVNRTLSGIVGRVEIYGFHPTKKRTRGRIANEKHVAQQREALRLANIKDMKEESTDGL